MKKNNIEFVVGIFLILGFLAFAYISLQFGEFSIFARGQNYTLSADFDDVSGLKKGAGITIAGVSVGTVSNIRLTKEQRAEVSLYLSNDVEITEDAIASIKTQGIIGDKYIRISQGGSETYLKGGGAITDTESAVDIEDLISKYIFGKI
ncbi:MAG: outer membrane lipid asymmetry maintenance protein MlaD [Proteobacteria bacterium]|nr:outer membrane lipid asymmetry maintenance protein MlaD [Pseudomonadota bacterium]MBU4297535.1 outer membrane lipid asymmetry maintenance protein MlaD [Pseudomonadota bacterium]MCG2749753.1 outer membrane lipid asymmetry maintenance protein MlaD [Desulfobulbaceae bacterium]